MTEPFRVTDAAEDNYHHILSMNRDEVPHVTLLNQDQLKKLSDDAFAFRVCCGTGNTVAGFILALAEGADYASENYRWFCDRYSKFVYVDRIVVHRDYRGSGIGRMLYRDLMACSAVHGDILTCEVNIQPPNPDSVSFHKALGFYEVGRQSTENGTKTVMLMAKRLNQ